MNLKWILTNKAQDSNIYNDQIYTDYGFEGRTLFPKILNGKKNLTFNMERNTL